MKIYLVVAQLKESYPGQYAPDVLSCATEYLLEENPDALKEDLAKAKAEKEFVAADIICIDVDQVGQKAIRDRLLNPLVIKGNVITNP